MNKKTPIYLILVGLLGAIALSASGDDTVPGNFSVGSLTFPRQPAPQYAVIDLGPNLQPNDINDSGEVLGLNYGNYADELWSGGNLTVLPGSDEDGDYYAWVRIANDGNVTGFASNAESASGFARRAPDGSVTTVFDFSSCMPDDAINWEVWNYSGDFFTRNGDVYFPFFYEEYTYFFTDADDNEYWEPNYYQEEICWSHNGTVSVVGSAVLSSGVVAPGSPTPVSFNLATDAASDTLSAHFGDLSYSSTPETITYVSSYAYDDGDDEYDIPVYSNYTYTDYELDSSDSVYYGDFIGYPLLELDGVALADSLSIEESDGGTGFCLATLNYPLVADPYGDSTLTYLSGGSLVAANLTANVDSSTILNMYGINSLGAGLVTYPSALWLNGAELDPTDYLPAWDFNDDLSLNVTALGVNITITGTPEISIYQISRASMLATGIVYDTDSSNFNGIVLLPASLAVDNNRDGNISFDIDDLTSEDNPFVFWLNNNIDAAGSESAYSSVQDDLDPTSGNVDWTRDTFHGTRDLEDFARLWLNVGALQNSIANGNISGNICIGLKWVPFANMTFNGTNDPAIKLYVAYGSGNADYLTNSTIAADQLTGNYANAIEDVSGVAGGANHTLIEPPASGSRDYDFIFPESVVANLTSANSTIHLLFEGCQSGNGELSLVFLLNNGSGNYTKIGSGPSVCLDLEDIKNLYERWTVGDGPSSGELSTWLTGEGGGGVPNSTANISTTGITGANFTDDTPDGTPYILFVHGWNVQPWEKDAFAQTAFKRLYWQGYQGRFGTFQWPTTYHTADIEAVFDYDIGEFTAWLSAKPLENLLTGTLATRYGSGNIYILAHSMGNVVTGEALRLAASDGSGQIVNTYVASQAAVPVHNYDPSQSAPSGFWGSRVIYSLITILGHSYGNISVSASPSTPNIYPFWFKPVSASGSSVVNFYNTNDFALNLAHWQTNAALKPDGWVYPVGYGTTGTNPFGYTSSNYTVVADDFCNTLSGNNALHLAAVSGNFAIGNTTYGTDLNDQYQIMAFAAQAQGGPLGDTAGVGNMTGNQSLQSMWGTDSLDPGNTTSPFYEHPWHSAEFRFDNATQNTYWHTLLGPNGFKLTP